MCHSGTGHSLTPSAPQAIEWYVDEPTNTLKTRTNNLGVHQRRGYSSPTVCWYLRAAPTPSLEKVENYSMLGLPRVFEYYSSIAEADPGICERGAGPSPLLLFPSRSPFSLLHPLP